MIDCDDPTPRSEKDEWDVFTDPAFAATRTSARRRKGEEAKEAGEERPQAAMRGAGAAELAERERKRAELELERKRKFERERELEREREREREAELQRERERERRREREREARESVKNVRSKLAREKMAAMEADPKIAQLLATHEAEDDYDDDEEEEFWEVCGGF